jgi:hypothetical protein
MLLMDAICQCVSIHRERALQLQRVVDDMPLTLLCGCGSQIAKAAGPAGPNYEYLFRLEEALYEIGCVDEYIIKLAKEVRKHLGHDGLLNGLLL